MKTTVSLIQLAVIAVTVIFSFLGTSCVKYKEGPIVSLRSREARISGKWIATKAKYNSIDSLAAYSKHIWEFTENGSVILQIERKKFTGVWTLITNNEDLEIKYDEAPGKVYKILKLMNKELWLRDKQSQLEIHLKPQ